MGKRKKKVLEEISIPTDNLVVVLDSVGSAFSDVEDMVEAIQDQLPKAPKDAKEKLIFHFTKNTRFCLDWIKEHKIELLFGSAAALILRAVRQTWRGGD